MPEVIRDADWFNEQLEALGMNQADFCRFLLENGDNRSLSAVQRSVGRMSRGEGGISGEMRVLLNLLRKTKAWNAERPA